MKTIRILACCLFVFGTFISLDIQPAVARPVLPGESCQTAPLSTWTEPEKWVWTRVCEGKYANFNARYAVTLDPKTPDGWTEKRTLSSRFLEAILLYEPFKSALTRTGVRIVGAWFRRAVDLADFSLNHPLVLLQSRFDGVFTLARLKSTSLISLDGSKFTRLLNIEAVEVGSYLLMRRAEFGVVLLRGARVGGQIDMRNSEFTGKLVMDALQVESSLLMRDGAEFGEVVLRGAKVGGQIDMRRSKFTSRLDMDALQVGRLLIMREGAEFGEVVLRGAKVNGQVDMSSSKFTGTLNMDSLTVRQHILMRGGNFTKPVQLTFTKIDSNLVLSGAKFNDLDLSGTEIKGELRLGSAQYSATKWEDDSRLTLRNTKVFALQDRKESWPNHLELELDGFIYNRLGGFAGTGTAEMTNRKSSWFEDWLIKDKTYSPQPYEQLAKVLRTAGQYGKADDILYAGRERERAAATGAKWVGLTLLNYSIGYGYGFRYFISLAWIAGLVFVGVVVLHVTREGTRHMMPYGWAYSLDVLLPIVHLRDYHYDNVDLLGFARYYFYFHKLMGYVLASFLIAGLSGLTQ